MSKSAKLQAKAQFSRTPLVRKFEVVFSLSPPDGVNNLSVTNAVSFNDSGEFTTFWSIDGRNILSVNNNYILFVKDVTDE